MGSLFTNLVQKVVISRKWTENGLMLDRERTDEVAEKSARMSAVWTMMWVKLVNLVNFVMQFFKWTKWTKWTEQIFVESAESAKSARSIFATFATFASANFVGKASCESTVRYREWSRISLIKPLLNPYLTLTRFRLSLGSNLSRFSLASLICLCMLTVGVGQMWGATTTYTFTAKEWTSAAGNWDGTAGYALETRGVQVTSSLSTTSPTSFSYVTSVVIVASSNNGTGTIKVSIGSDEVATKTISNSNNVTYTYDFLDDEDIVSYSGKVKLDITSGTKSVFVKSVAVTYISDKFTVTYNAGSGTCATASKKQDAIGEILTLPTATPNSDCVDDGWTFAGWSPSSCSVSYLRPDTVYAGSSSYMPLKSLTLYAVYKKGNSYDIDFESASSAYTDWTFNNMTSQQTSSITAHAGTYYGTTGGKATASLTSTNKLASPKKLRFYISRQTTNTNSSSWYVQTSANGSDWTDRKTQDAVVTVGAWTEVTQDLSSYSDVYVRIYYSGSTAVRNIDDVELSCATYNSNPDCTYDWFIDIMHDNETIEKQGSYSMPAALSDASKGDDYCDEKHYHFLGWVEESYINDDGTLMSGATLYPAGDGGHTAANKTFYAIWAKEE